MKKLPKRVYAKHGSLWFVDLNRKWHKLCRATDSTAKMYLALAAIVEAPPMTRMAAAIGAFKKDYLPTLALGSRDEHERLLDKAAEEFEAFDVADVKPADISRSVKNLYAGKLTAARHYKSRLSTFFRWAVTEGLRNENPCREVWLAAPPRRDRYITDDEFLSVREWLLKGDDDRPTRAGVMAQCFIDLCYLTAQRPTEIRRLLWSQVRENGIAFKPSKTKGSSGAKVVVPITPEIKAVLDIAKAFEPPKKKRNGKPQSASVRSIYVIHTLDGSPYTMSGIRSAWQRACVRAGITDATIKDLRAKSLTDAKRSGYMLEELKTVAAHTSVTTTEVYLKTFDEPVSVIRLAIPTAKKLDTTGES